MNHFGTLLVFVIGSVLFSGCTKRERPEPPDYKINPTPTEEYKVTVEASEAIFRAVKIEAQYNISDMRCVPIDHGAAIGGLRIQYRARLEAHPLVASSGKSMVIRAHGDRIVPSDYWGLGICQWELLALKISGGDGVEYVVNMYGDDVIHEREVKWVCDPRIKSRTAFKCFVQTEGAEPPQLPKSPRDRADDITITSTSERVWE